MNPANPKLLTLAEAVARREELRAEKKLVVLTNGVFDLLHEGHLNSLRADHSYGALFVAINSDESVRAIKGPTRPIENETERARKLAALDYVDVVVIFRTPRLTAEIKALKPDIYCKSGDYNLSKLNPDELQALEEVGAKIKFVPCLVGHSTTAKIAKMKAAGEL